MPLLCGLATAVRAGRADFRDKAFYPGMAAQSDVLADDAGATDTRCTANRSYGIFPQLPGECPTVIGDAVLEMITNLGRLRKTQS